ncbi:hypothetical protein OVA11_06625 [Caulobacter sp. SL161]|nr:hypothetical protein [Caulobacter sp. SL161]MCY1646756.1 hypothetical protein [Caulobacter sp. SL161]
MIILPHRDLFSAYLTQTGDRRPPHERSPSDRRRALRVRSRRSHG